MGIKLGLINEELRERYRGLEVGLKNYAIKLRGIQIGGINFADELSYGAQIGPYNHALESRGAQIGFDNRVYRSSHGVQIGVINSAKELRGAQIGFCNLVRKRFRGLQLGILSNYCGPDSAGVQVALINIRAGNHWYSKIIPIIAVRTKKLGLEEKVES